jgi:hypothetical protein
MLFTTVRPQLESLEPRTLAAAFVVTSANDAGPGCRD